MKDTNKNNPVCSTKMTPNHSKCVPMQSWSILTLLLVGSLIACKDEQEKKIVSHTEIQKTRKSDTEHVLKQAKLFLHLIIGSEARAYYNDPKRQPEILFLSEKNRWNVFFTYSLGGFNIQLSNDAERANYLFQSGSVLKMRFEDEVDPSGPPLFTADEIVELLSLPHNKL